MKLFSVIGLIVTLSCIQGSDIPENIKSTLSSHFTTGGFSCVDKFSVSFDDIALLQSFKIPKSPDAMCFFACIMKKDNLLDKNGKVSFTAVRKMAKKLFQDKAERDTAIEIFESCESVNDEPVSDAEKGCDRARLILTCITNTGKGQPSSSNTSPETGIDSQAGVQTGSNGNNAVLDVVRNRFRTVARLILKEIFLQPICQFINGLNIQKDTVISKLLPTLTRLSTLCSAFKHGANESSQNK